MAKFSCVCKLCKQLNERFTSPLQPGVVVSSLMFWCSNCGARLEVSYQFRDQNTVEVLSTSVVPDPSKGPYHRKIKWKSPPKKKKNKEK